MTSAARWSIAGLVLVVAAIVAIWPRSPEAPATRHEPDVGAEAGTDAGTDVGVARAAAGLEPCPDDGGDLPPGLRALSGVDVECLADGSDVDLAVALADRPVLVNVWATWCQPCREELPLLAAYAAEPGAVDVVGLAVQSTEAGALELLDTIDVRLPTLADASGAARRALKVPVGLPASYLVAADGTVSLVEDPRLFRSVEQIRRAVARV